MAALTEEQGTQIELVVLKAIDAYHKVQDELVQERIDTHQKTCPIGEEVRISKAKLSGLLWGIGLGSAGISGTIATILSRLMS